MRQVFEIIGNVHFICAASLVIIFGAHNFVFAELIPTQSCNLTPSNSCQILNITVDPCPEAQSDQPCNFYRGTNSTFTMYYKPNFNAEKLQMNRYSVVLFVDIPDPTFFDHDACRFTSCPIAAGGTYRFQQNLAISEFYPPGIYTAKWKIWNENDEECCFKTTAAVV